MLLLLLTNNFRRVTRHYRNYGVIVTSGEIFINLQIFLFELSRSTFLWIIIKCIEGHIMFVPPVGIINT